MGMQPDTESWCVALQHIASSFASNALMREDWVPGVCFSPCPICLFVVNRFSGDGGHGAPPASIG
jgi:hypothetical protein